MSVAAKALINSGYASNSLTTLYTCPALTVALIDKFTANNTSGSTATVDIYIVPSGGSAGVSNKLVSALSLTAGQILDVGLQNHILNAGDFIAAQASAASAIVVRASGREAS